MKKSLLVTLPVATFIAGMAAVPSVFAIGPTSIPNGGQTGLKCETPAAVVDGITTYNCKLEAQAEGHPEFDFVVGNNEVLNLDLNGQTLTNWHGTADNSNNVSAVWVQKGGAMTITDSAGGGIIGSSDNSTENTPVISVQDGAKLEIHGGTLTTTRKDGTAIVYNEGELEISGSTTIATSGNYEEWETGAWGITNTASGNVTISGGIFTQNSILPLIQNHGSLAISGGEFETTKEDAQPLIANEKSLDISGGEFDTDAVVTNGENATAVVSGGTFSNPTAVAEYLASGLEFNADGTVVEKAETPTETPTEETTENPNTADPIALYATVAVLAVLGLGATAVVAKKSNR